MIKEIGEMKVANMLASKFLKDFNPVIDEYIVQYIGAETEGEKMGLM